jgi:spoIIIJ-associated protein
MIIAVEAKSLPLALVKAASKLGLTQEEVAYKVVEKSRGFLGLFGGCVKIEAWKKPIRSREPYREKRRRLPEAPRTNAASAEEMEKLTQEVKLACEKLCTLMGEAPQSIEAFYREDTIHLNVQDETLLSIVKRNAKLIDAFEHILRKIPSGHDISFRVFLDVGEMRKAREAELLGVAEDLSQKVHQDKKPIVLNYRSAYDRKIIHMALDQDDRVYTKSIGNGPNRKLMILPNTQGSHG